MTQQPTPPCNSKQEAKPAGFGVLRELFYGSIGPMDQFGKRMDFGVPVYLCREAYLRWSAKEIGAGVQTPTCCPS